MNKKGFTLIELMGIIIILSLISLLVIPTIDRSIKLFKENAYNNQINNIKLAARNWGADNLYKFDFDSGDAITISLGQLQIGSYVENDLKNPKTGIAFPDDMLISIVKSGKKITYTVLDATGLENSGLLDENAPTIELNGSYIERINQGSIYLDKGVIAKTSAGVTIGTITQVITKDGLTVGSVNTTVLGTYIISYSVTDSSLTRTIFRTVIVGVVPTIVDNNSKLTSVEVLVVAGGGGGANTGSGGGAGGYIYNPSFPVSSQTYLVTVGLGGLGATSGPVAGNKGSNSSFSTLIAEGGGAGYSHGSSAGGNGGSGGGGPLKAGVPAATGGLASSGNAGGAGTVDAGWLGTSGGGGGAGAAGNAGSNLPSGGKGGDGLANSISGTSVYYAGGGCGGEVNGSYVSTGGLGGGGNCVVNGAGLNATGNTGGGGGGGSFTGSAYLNGGNGGSGVVIIRYLGSKKAADGGVVTTAGGYVIHTFKEVGTYIFKVW